MIGKHTLGYMRMTIEKGVLVQKPPKVRKYAQSQQALTLQQVPQQS